MQGLVCLKLEHEFMKIDMGVDLFCDANNLLDLCFAVYEVITKEPVSVRQFLNSNKVESMIYKLCGFRGSPGYTVDENGFSAFFGFFKKFLKKNKEAVSIIVKLVIVFFFSQDNCL